ncbi:hypothetical protein PPIS_b0128 [Pseudoalteromonas piscicida]|uniref:Uncharacterized protein n=1 Tax=Pseudoalteromonas piscicida TaxID=43662 RepID=A0ABN5CIA3_PSEO7|nr:hypothetical protein PPIS_b0128 [Pseudoalteromonas piscicida]
MSLCLKSQSAIMLLLTGLILGKYRTVNKASGTNNSVDIFVMKHTCYLTFPLLLS